MSKRGGIVAGSDTDGTKIEANANRYTFVWAKTVERNKQRIREQLRDVWKYVERASAEEEQAPNEPDFEAVDPEAVTRGESDRRGVAESRARCEDKAAGAEIEAELPGRAAKVEAQERMLDGRRSSSKTDQTRRS
ncbi:MAG: hypothetical protein IPN69_01790 [Acidobacteria bacterium]|nr:hypothetical protein [Acidobacteriota bacterium]